jgi:fructosamine-3-kinase
MSLWSTIADVVARERGVWLEVDARQRVGGGSISPAYRVPAGDADLFVKTGSVEESNMFAAEAAALELLAQPGVIRVPQPIGQGVQEEGAFLVMEYIPMGRPGPNGERLLGEGLARIHEVTRSDYGWDRDNTIGSTPQPNRRDPDWVRFFAQQRLGVQLDLVASWGGQHSLVQAGRRLQQRLGAFFSDYTPSASLLHGDLWGGNAAYDRQGRPVIFDPATYFGDRETDLAMTELFGGFGRDFYAGYNAVWPLDPGYPTRRELYQLYHVLNHFNIFGGMYAASAKRLIDRLLASAG